MKITNRILPCQAIILILLSFFLLDTALYAQADQQPTCIYVEAKERNKEHPNLPKWKRYPARTIACLADCPQQADRITRRGSWQEVRFPATGYFHTAKHNNRWVLVDPEGYLHLEAAVVGIRPGKGETNRTHFATKFHDTTDWMNQTIEQLVSYGFNGAGTWSDEATIRAYNQSSQGALFSCSPMLNLMAGYGRKLKITRQLAGNTGYPNQCIPVFNPGFEAYCEQVIPELVAAHKNDANVLGFFSDNELPISKKNLEGYLTLPEDDYGRKEAERWLEQQGITAAQITDAHRCEFAGYVSERYYATVRRILKKHAPNHLYLGSRLHGGAKFIREVVEAAGRHCDVISFNYYGFWTIRKQDIAHWEEWGKKPFIITEFYTKGEDSGLANTSGAGWNVRTQEARGIHYETFILNLLESNNCVGWSWFRYQDNDPTAKGVDPSNIDANKGCFDNQYEPYLDLVKHMRDINTIKYALMQQALQLP